MANAIEKELMNSREYQKVLAELSPSEKLRLLGKDFNLQRELAKKKEYRRTLASLSPGQKLKLLERLRNRAQAQRGLRRSASPELLVSAKALNSRKLNLTSGTKKNGRSGDPTETSRKFGGRSTSSGVNYEVRIATNVAVKMLGGAHSSVWDGISGDKISAITMQAPEAIDDIVVSLSGECEGAVFISAKMRSGKIALTKRSPAYTETVDAFVRQFLSMNPNTRKGSRFIWAVPTSSGREVTDVLADSLRSHRLDSGDASIRDFLRGRRSKENKALGSLISLAAKAWKKASGNAPTDEQLRQFLRIVYVEAYDFELGRRAECEVETEIRSNILLDPNQAPRVQEKLEHFFAQVDQRGVRVTAQSLRHLLTGAGFALKAPPDYASENAYLRELTTRNLDLLKEHTELCFGSGAADSIHIARNEESNALMSAAKRGHLLLTGVPGCGKSGLIHDLVETLGREEVPVVLLLAEEIFGSDWKGSSNLPGLTHALDDVLANWPNGERGFVVTDALDAVRDVETQKRLRQLLRSVQCGQSGWNVIASVREFDLRFGRELREAFPGAGVEGHAAEEFSGIAHFHLTGLSDTQLDDLGKRQEKIRPFIENARRNSARAGGIHQSPFYLRLAADLLRHGESPARLADWTSPAVLLRSFWTARVKGGAGEAEREAALEAICRQMVDMRRMTVSFKELSIGVPERNAIRILRTNGILQTPAFRHGNRVGDDELRFTHHLLHDYAIARSLIPETEAPFCAFSVKEPLLPIFYRQSFMFALEELWDSSRAGFWGAALRLEGVAELHGITRILAPVLAARRVETLSDVQPLLLALGAAIDFDSPAQKALRHLAAGLQDAARELVHAGAMGWSAFASALAQLLPNGAAIEGPLAQILGRLNSVGISDEPATSIDLNTAARALLAHHVTKNVSKGWRYAGLVAIETVCRTYSFASEESERSLLSLLLPERLAFFPHDDLHDLAENLKFLGDSGDIVVLRLFEAAFGSEPPSGEWAQRGSAILGMNFQTSDEWNLVHFVLAGYYEQRKSDNPGLMTEAACVAWNAVVRRREERSRRAPRNLATISFREQKCELIEDYSHIWGRGFENEENRILTRFEILLRQWAAESDPAHLNQALDRFAAKNRTSLLWNILMEVGAEFPLTLGLRLENLLNEPTVLIHPDYAYAGVKLFTALHRVGESATRARLENLILRLPQDVKLRRGEAREPIPERIQHAQNRLLGALVELDIVLESIRVLMRERRAMDPLPANERPVRPAASFVRVPDDELLAQQGINPALPENKEMLNLREALKPLLERDNKAIAINAIEQHWPAVLEAKQAVLRHGETQAPMAQELWGHLVSACEIIARRAEWPRTDERWETIRHILLVAVDDPVPVASEDEEAKEDSWPTWGWPSPRLDAARGLPFIAYRLGKADEAITAALKRLAIDKSFPLRFNLADRLAVLEGPAPELMWELIDLFISEEKKFSVLDGLLQSLNQLWEKEPTKVKVRVDLVAARTSQSALAENHIHETLGHTYLFRFLRSGDSDCYDYILRLLPACDTEPAHHALSTQLHACRDGGWLTEGDTDGRDKESDEKRARAWGFFNDLLLMAQLKLQQQRAALQRLHEEATSDESILKPIKDRLHLAAQLVDGIAGQLYFASGAFELPHKTDKGRLTPEQFIRFWKEASPIFRAIASEPHPHTAHQLVQTLSHVLPCAPEEIFLLATRSIQNSAEAGFHRESLAVAEVVKLIQRALADYRELFRSESDHESECLVALLKVLDLFVEAGWAEARQLTHRLEEIYR